MEADAGRCPTVLLFQCALTPDHQVSFVLLFWIWRLVYGREIPPRLFWLRKMNRALGPWMNVLAPELRITDQPHTAHFSPWQIIVGTLTAMYASRNLDKLLGLGGTRAFYISSYPRLTRAVLPRSFPVAVRRTSSRAPGRSRAYHFRNHDPELNGNRLRFA